MASLNGELISKKGSEYGFNIGPGEADQILSQTRGGDPYDVDLYFKNRQAQGEIGKAGSSDTLIQNAQKLLDFQKTANQPIVSALQGQIDPLKKTYEDLIASIKGNQQLDINRQTLATNNEFAKRGISNTSGVYEQGLANSLVPVNTQYSGVLASTGMEEQQKLMDLATKIAQYQAGDPNAAISGGLSAQGNQIDIAKSLAALSQNQWNRYNPSALETAQINQANAESAFSNAKAGGILAGQFNDPKSLYSL